MEDEIITNGEPALIPLGGSYEYRREGGKKRVAVIGAGPAGLAAVRRIAEADMEVICYEQGPSLGGIWNYSEGTSNDETGTPLHAFIYRDLRTNLPKEVMMFPDFPYHDTKESYIHSTEVVRYLKDYASHHNLEKYIKYRHMVKEVKPLSNCWSLTALDLTSKQDNIKVFDSIFVCSGPNVTPLYPDIELARFSGKQIHSKNYRVPEVYQDKTVLLIGLGPSGLDLAYQLQPVAKQIFLSSNRGKVIDLPDRVQLKPVVKSVEDKIVTFMDDTSVHIDHIIHCTGYTFHFPFLHRDCGVTVDKYVFPLYKHFISIEKPTLFFIGLPRLVNHLHMCDYQAQTAVKTLQGEVVLPSKDEMNTDLKEDIENRLSQGQKKNGFHTMSNEFFDQYFDDIATLGGLDPLPSVQRKMFQCAHTKSIKEFATFRNFTYRIINDEEFSVEELEIPESAEFQ